jgi:aryl-alcohol dehydrogenase-like predicted oxidoreductase
MRQTELGTTALRVTALGLGLAALGRPGYINLGHADDLAGEYSPESMEARAHRVLDAAWAGGVRYFDAARSYGRGEAFLGSWLASRDVAPEDVTVGSKWGYVYTAGWQVDARVHEVKEHSAAVLRRQLAETRALLGAHLDLYQIHSATPESGVLDDGQVIDELARLRASGVRVGLSVSGATQAATIRQALAVERDGRPLFDAVQATWNLLDPSAGEALAEARERGLGVIVKEALANGRLTERNADPAFAGGFALLSAQAQRLGTSVDAVALGAALAQPWADVVLSGAATAEQLHSNLAATGGAWDDEAAHRLSALAVAPEAYWSQRSALRWN